MQFLTKITRYEKNRKVWGFPGGLVIKNLPATAGDTGSIPGLEDPTCRGAAKPQHHKYWASAWSPGATTAETVCLNYRTPRALEPVSCSKRSHCSEEPMYCKYRVAPAHCNKDPAWQKINTQILKIHKSKYIFKKKNMTYTQEEKQFIKTVPWMSIHSRPLANSKWIKL